jgi:DNA-binding transcriptional LysR family regulator
MRAKFAISSAIVTYGDDVQLELVGAGAAVALMPPLALPTNDPAVAVRDIAEATLKRRLVIVTRDTPPAPTLTALLTAVTDQAACATTSIGRVLRPGDPRA